MTNDTREIFFHSDRGLSFIAMEQFYRSIVNADSLTPIARREIAARTRVTPVLYVMTPL